MAGKRHQVEQTIQKLREAEVLLAQGTLVGPNPVTQLKPAFYPPGFVKQGLYEEGLVPRPELNQAIRELNDYLSQKTPKEHREKP